MAPPRESLVSWRMREANKKQLSDVEDTPMEIKQEAKETTRLEPSSYRPSWQSVWRTSEAFVMASRR